MEQSVLTKCQAAEAVDHLQVSDAGRFSCNLLGWMVPGARVRGGEVTLTARHLSIPRLPITFPLFRTMLIIRLLFFTLL